MKPVVSVVIATHNEWHYTLNQTLKNIRDTGGYWVEIVLVDDASSTRVTVDDPDIKLIHNRRRLGVGPSRHIGVEAASSPLIVITDSHVRFQPGWVPIVYSLMPGCEHVVLCGKCIALDENKPSFDSATGEYNGARMSIYNPDEPLRWKILTAKWAVDRPGKDLYPLSAMMGACYAIHKVWFQHIGGLKLLKNFGGDEELMSIRTIRAAGTIRMFKQLQIGHIFRSKIAKPPYRITIEECLRNTIAIALTCCPPEVAQELIDKLERTKEVKRALDLISEDLQLIQKEQDEMASVLTLPWGDYLYAIAAIDKPAP